jgi:hypothetical protein
LIDRACGTQRRWKLPSQVCLKNLQARRLSNLEVVPKLLARTERPFFKHMGNCSRKIIRQKPSGLGIIK